MSPGLRSDGRAGHPEELGGCGADPGGCWPPRTDAGGEKGRCVRRSAAAGMLLSVAVLAAVVRCAAAAEGKHKAPTCRKARFVAFLPTGAALLSR